MKKILFEILQMIVNQVGKNEIQFSPFRSPRLHQITPLSMQISKITRGRMLDPPTCSRAMGAPKVAFANQTASSETF